MWLYNVGPQWAKRLTLTGDSISGADAAKIGLVMKSVPADLLAAEVEHLLDRLALIDADLLSSNKRIINLALELMGARTLQRLAAENDARAHLARSAREFVANAREKGLKAALRERDEKFGEGRVRIDEPDAK
jgi:enoyl-CoA hydratase